MIAPGVRVVRGPDWIWQNQGEFEAHEENSLLGRKRNQINMKLFPGRMDKRVRCYRHMDRENVNICQHFKFLARVEIEMGKFSLHVDGASNLVEGKGSGDLEYASLFIIQY
jgi:hypothetical protein